MTNHVNRLGRELRILSAGPPDPPPPAEPDTDADQLAREAAQAFADEIAQFRSARAKDKPPDPALSPEEWDLKMIRQKAPDDFTFYDFDRLAGRGRVHRVRGRAAAVTKASRGQ